MIVNPCKTILCAAIFAVAVPLTAGGSELPQDLIDCRAIASAVARLDCYDRLADTQAGSSRQETRSAATPATQPAAVAPAPSAPAATPAPEISQEALFGKDPVEVRETVQKATGASEIDEIESRISNIRYSTAGKAIITLDNGQVWTQIDNARLRLSEYDPVVIRRAALGSFMLRKASSKTPMRVKRIS